MSEPVAQDRGSALLAVEGVRMAYGAVTALDGVSLSVRRGSITGLIGPNGSGKSTLFDCISGFQRHLAGSVRFHPREGEEAELSARAPAQIARMGLRRTFQQLRVFPELSARENLLAAAQAAPGFSVFSEVLRLPAVRRHEREMQQRADELLGQLALVPKAGTLAGELSYGQKKLVELGMALMGRPELLLLDEPVAGVNPTLIEGLKAHLLAFRDRGVTLFVVEHNLKLVFEICDWIYVLDQGRLLTQGTPSQVANDARVVAAYLGRGGPQGEGAAAAGAAGAVGACARNQEAGRG